MKKIILLIFLVCASLCACHTSKTATGVYPEHSRRDTLYLNKLQYDSIFITQEHFVDRSSDTVRIRDVCVQYKYKLLQDTVFKCRVDSIPVIKTVEVVKTERYIPTIYKWSLGICIALIVLLIVYLALKLYFHKL